MSPDRSSVEVLPSSKENHLTLTGDPSLVNPPFDDPPSNPLLMLRDWLVEADRLGVSEPRGCVLSTIDIAGLPWGRVVLLKGCDDTGVTFATSQESAKGRDIEASRYAAGTLWWRETVQQVSFRGRVLRLSEQASDQEFRARTREAQAVAAVSRQSAPLVDEERLKAEVLKLLHTEGRLARPDKWYVYHLAIESIEFWHGRRDRFHKRLRYDLRGGIWTHQRLQP